MKTQPDKTPEQQSDTAPKIQQEPGTGGTATITDNRPSTIYQRKLRESMANSPRVKADAPLRETMNASAAAKTIPLQRKAPKGSSRFRQIATAMGEQHEVDTSGLAATHNSAFPARLNAEATIQGNSIHFAPGMDSDYNIRHEVAHAIDNTLNGTPKGDRVVNGQRVDTTREKTVDRMAREPAGSQGHMTGYDNAGTEKQIHLTAAPQSILQRKLTVGDEETDERKAWEYINDNNHDHESAFKEGIFPVYDKIDEKFEDNNAFTEQLKNILPQYSKLWNVENGDASTYIQNQIEVQEEIKDDLAPYHHLLTTVGSEYEFASIEDSFLSGVPHLEIAETEQKMPLTGIPFILETDASNSLELVGPPFLLPTVLGVPLPHPGVTEAIDDKMQRALKRTLQEKRNVDQYHYTNKMLDTMLEKLNEELGVDFAFNETTAIKAENLSKNINPEELKKLVTRSRGGNFTGLVVTPDHLKTLIVKKSEKVEAYEENLQSKGKKHSHLKHGIAPQLNFATDIPTVALFEKADQDALSGRDQVFIEIEKILKAKLTKPEGPPEKMEYFYTQMIRKLAGLFGVYYQKKTREMQHSMYNYITGNNDDPETFENIKEGIKAYSTFTSRVKDTTSVWVKDHLVSIALMFENNDIKRIVQSLKNVSFQAQDFEQLNEIEMGRYRGAPVTFGVYEVYTEGIAPFVALLNDAIKTTRGDLREKYETFKRLRRKPYRLYTGTALDSKPKVSELFEHDKAKVGARQDTYLDPKKVQQPGLWSGRRLHVGEVREGHIDTLWEVYRALLETGDEEEKETL